MTRLFASLAQPPRVKPFIEDGEELCHAPEIAGPYAWAQLHGWAQNIYDWICPVCGGFAIAAARALHDVVNSKLGKPVLDAENLRNVAHAFAAAASGRHQDAYAAQRARHDGHLHKQSAGIDVRGDGAILEQLRGSDRLDPGSLAAQQKGGHVEREACPASKWSRVTGKCNVTRRLHSIAHPRAEETDLLGEAITRKLPILSEAKPDPVTTRRFASLLKGPAKKVKGDA